MANTKEQVNPYVQKYETALNMMVKRTKLMQEADALAQEYEKKEKTLTALTAELKKLRRDFEALYKEEIGSLDKELIAVLERLDKSKPIEIVDIKDVTPAATPNV